MPHKNSIRKTKKRLRDEEEKRKKSRRKTALGRQIR